LNIIWFYFQENFAFNFLKYWLIFLCVLIFISYFFLLQNHRSDVADITPLLRIGLVSDKLMFLLGQRMCGNFINYYISIDAYMHQFIKNIRIIICIQTSVALKWISYNKLGKTSSWILFYYMEFIVHALWNLQCHVISTQ